MESIAVNNDFPLLKFHRRIFSFYCNDCKSCLKPVSIIIHFKNTHPEMDLSILKNMNFNDLLDELTFQSQELGFLNYSFEPSPIKPLYDFPVFKCYKCSISNCEFLVRESSPNLLKIMKNHLKSYHPDFSYNENLFIMCYCQSLSKGGGKKKFIHVLSPSESRMDEEELKPSMLDNHPPSFNRTRNIFDEIGFIFKKENLYFHYRISSDNLNEEESIYHSKFEIIYKKFIKCIDKCIDLLKKESLILKKLIGTTSLISDSIFNKNSKLLRIVERETLERYKKFFKRLLYFLFRIHLHSLEDLNKYGIEMTNEQYDIIKNLSINNNEDLRSNIIIEDIVNVLNERYIETNGKLSIISLFLKSCCITEKCNFVSVETISSYCTSIKYISRLICLYKVNNVIKGLYGKSYTSSEILNDNNTLFILNKTGIEDVDKIIMLVKNNIATPFGQLLNISNYCRKFVSLERIPVASWSRIPDKNGRNGIINLSGFNFYIDDIIIMKKKIMNEIKLIYEKCFFMDINEMKHIVNGHDDRIWHENGIIKDEIRFHKQNNEYEKYIKDYLFNIFSKKEDFYKERSWNFESLKSIKEKIDMLVKMLFVLIHISIGGVPRAPEYETFFIRSCYNNTRSVFIDDKNVVLVSYKTKTSKHNESRRIIPRFVDEESSFYLLVYISIIKPFDKFIYHILNRNDMQSDEIYNHELFNSLFNIGFKKIKKEEYRKIFLDIFVIRKRSISFKEFRHINHMMSHIIPYAYPKNLSKEIINIGFDIDHNEVSYLLKFYLCSSISNYFIRQSGHNIETAGDNYGYGYHPYINHYDYMNYKLASLLYHDIFGSYMNKEGVSQNNDKKGILKVKKGNKLEINEENNEEFFNNNIYKNIINNVINEYGLEYFMSDHQKKSILYSLRGFNTIIRIITSGGKTLIYEMAEKLDLRRGLSFIFLPFNSLIDEKFKNLRIDNLIIWEQDIFFNKKYLFSDKATILATYHALLNNSYGINDIIKYKYYKKEIRNLIFDEFDFLFGYDNENIGKYETIGIIQFIRSLNLNMMFLSSTFRKEEMKFIKDNVSFADKKTKIIEMDINKKNIHYNVLKFDYNDDLNVNLYKIINPFYEKGMKVLIFCMSIEITIKTYEFLKINGMRTSRYFSSLTKDEKKENMKRFLDGESLIMVSTTSLGVGIDIRDIRVVVHINGFYTVKNFIQETGRAGRDGNPCASYVIISKSDYFKDKNVLEYIKSEECRRGFIKKYMDGYEGYKCNDYDAICDNCQKMKRGIDIYINDQSKDYIEILKSIKTKDEEKKKEYQTLFYEDNLNENDLFDPFYDGFSKEISITIEENDYDEILKFISENIGKKSRCPYCFKRYSYYNDHKSFNGLCNKIDINTCIKCFRYGHNKKYCILKIDTMKRYCYFCLFPSSIYNSRIKKGINYHKEQFSYCGEGRKDVIKSYVSNMFLYLEKNKKLKKKFEDEVFIYKDEEEYLKKSYSFVKEDLNIIYSLLIYYWGIKNEIDPYIE